MSSHEAARRRRRPFGDSEARLELGHSLSHGVFLRLKARLNARPKVGIGRLKINNGHKYTNSVSVQSLNINVRRFI